MMQVVRVKFPSRDGPPQQGLRALVDCTQTGLAPTSSMGISSVPVKNSVAYTCSKGRIKSTPPAKPLKPLLHRHGLWRTSSWPRMRYLTNYCCSAEFGTSVSVASPNSQDYYLLKEAEQLSPASPNEVRVGLGHASVRAKQKSERRPAFS